MTAITKPMTGPMTEPMAALKGLQTELANGIALMECELNPRIDLIQDYPAGQQSMSYSRIEQGIVRSIAVLVPVEPIDGVPCFKITFAVCEASQGQGLAVEIVEVAIAELRHGLGRNGIVAFLIEAIIGTDNVLAQKVANRVLSQDHDDVAYEDANAKFGVSDYQYRRLVTC
jgi:GNAT superfamily N-acetyltransferase